MKTGIIVGRFQCPELHEGHKDLISHVMRRNDKLVVVIGTSAAIYTDKHPLPFDTRAQMILDKFPFVDVLQLEDHPSDEQWCKNLDELVKEYKNITLYGSRDSFLKVYTGDNKTEEFEPIREASSTKIREEIASRPFISHNKEFRKGMIHVIENRRPVVYPTVDIAILNDDTTKILLGRKKGQKLWVFPGGFVDPKDFSFKDAAIREMKEEVVGIEDWQGMELIYTGKVEDYRYIGTKDSILTSLFITYISGSVKAGDDLEKVRWYTLKDFDVKILAPSHHKLMEELKLYLKSL